MEDDIIIADLSWHERAWGIVCVWYGEKMGYEQKVKKIF